MPLGQRPGDKSDSRYCGAETDFDDDMPQVLAFNLGAGFDFVVAPLIDPGYRPSLAKDDSNGAGIPPFAGSDLVLSPAQWSSHVVVANADGFPIPMLGSFSFRTWTKVIITVFVNTLMIMGSLPNYWCQQKCNDDHNDYVTALEDVLV